LNLAVFDRRLVISAIIISVLAFLSKLIGCGLPVLRSGWKMALKVGVGMTPRGEVGLIVALIGLQMNVISQSAYALVIFMTAATTLIAPAIMRLMFRDDAVPEPGFIERRRRRSAM
jgi:Kef-type K+ transport system membrane component KefB